MPTDPDDDVAGAARRGAADVTEPPPEDRVRDIFPHKATKYRITGCAKKFVLSLLLKNHTCFGSYELKFEPEYLSWSY